MNANDRLAALLVDAVLAHRRRWHDMQAVDRPLEEVVADAFPEATPAEIEATVAYVRDASSSGGEGSTDRRLYHLRFGRGLKTSMRPLSPMSASSSSASSLLLVTMMVRQTFAAVS